MSFKPSTVSELEFWSESGRTRDELLERMVSHGWKAAAEDSRWDLERDGCRVLVATELGDGPGRLTRVRVAGEEQPVRAGVGEVNEVAEGW